MAKSLPQRWLPRSSDFEQWLSLAVAAVVFAAVSFAAGDDVALLRGLVFVGTPLAWLASMAPRLHEYLHAPARAELLPLPLPPRSHWDAAAVVQRAGVVWALGLSTAAVVAGAGLHVAPPVLGGLVADALWLGVVMAAVEPWAPALAAWLGRRFAPDSLGHRMQTSLSGGWTLPEAASHLYTPPLVLALATALALPGQLWIDFTVDDLPRPLALTVAAAVGPALALVVRPLAPRLYARGLFEAVPWLVQATRTLAGPPTPVAAPAFVTRVREPDVRLFLLQLWRTTPVPGLRLWTLLLVAGWVGLVAGPTLPRVTVVGTCALAWLVPAARVAFRLAPGRVAWLSMVDGRPRPAGALAWVIGPVVVALALVFVGWMRAA